jgi:SAM-dependent methyltransferase
MKRQPNAYADPARAESYARIEFPGTYWLAYRDLPALMEKHVRGRRALDFGCGAGRSTRFLRALGFEVVGVDVSLPMLQAARERDPGGRYEQAEERDLDRFPAGGYDLVLCAYPFDNIPGQDRRASLMGRLRQRLARDGRLILLASSPELYTREWLTFTTAAFPENARARKGGDPVRIVIKGVGDERPIDDLIWFDDDYRRTFRQAGLHILESHRPLGREGEPHAWVNERRVAPWVIYVTAPVAG